MRYHPDTQTLHEVAVTPLSEKRLQELAALKGKTVEGGFVAQVAVVFVDDALAQSQLQQVRRFGLELRSFVEGREVVLNAGTRVADGPRPPDGVLLPVLREESWPHVTDTAHRRLLEGPANVGPWVTFGYDTPKQVARVGIGELARRSLEDFEAEALRNLAAREPRIHEQPGLVELRDEYAPEMLLLPDRMREIGARLKTELFLVSVPQEGSLLAVSATEAPNAICKLAREKFEGSKHRRISPLPIIVGQGKPVGFASITPFVPLSETTEISGGMAPASAPRNAGPAEPDPFAEEPPKKPWWKFW